MLAWLTPEEIPQTQGLVSVAIPRSEQFIAALRGALLLLTYPENWEQFGLADRCDVANAWLDALLTVKWGGGMPIGSVFWFAGETPPDGTLLCDGSQVSSDEYPALAAICGDLFGTGDPGYFRLPNLVASFAAGSGTRGGFVAGDVGNTGGVATVTLTTNQIPSHAHALSISLGGPLSLAPPLTPFMNAILNEIGYTWTTPAGGGQAHTNIPPYLALLPVIQAV